MDWLQPPVEPRSLSARVQAPPAVLASALVDMVEMQRPLVEEFMAEATEALESGLPPDAVYLLQAVHQELAQSSAPGAEADQKHPLLGAAAAQESE